MPLRWNYINIKNPRVNVGQVVLWLLRDKYFLRYGLADDPGLIILSAISGVAPRVDGRLRKCGEFCDVLSQETPVGGSFWLPVVLGVDEHRSFEVQADLARQTHVGDVCSLRCLVSWNRYDCGVWLVPNSEGKRVTSFFGAQPIIITQSDYSCVVAFPSR